MQESMEEIVRLVTEQVLAALQHVHHIDDDKNEGKKRCLVLGDGENVPEALRQDMILLDVKDYENIQNIKRYSRVLITKLTMPQLADIALGRPGDATACAVCQALLHGVEVLMLENAASHRAYAGMGSNAFYRMLEGYLNTLQVFGIKLVTSESPQLKMTGKLNKKPVRYEVTDMKLITENAAEQLVKNAQELVIPVDTLITPAAMDVFKETHVELIRR